MTDLAAAVAHWREHGHVLLPGYPGADEIAAGQAGLAEVHPSAEAERYPGLDRSGWRR